MIFFYDNNSLSNAEGCAATVGMFDGVHLGHQHIIDSLCHLSSERGLRPTVITFDRHPRSILRQNGRPISMLCSLDERLRLLQESGDVDVVVMPFTDALAQMSACQFLEHVLVQQMHAKFLLLGYDNTFGSKINNDFDHLPETAARCGVELQRAQPIFVEGDAVSSTRVRNNLMSGDVALASRLLGRPYSLGGMVTYGRGEGRKLGVPTANVKVGAMERLLPADGVYCVTVSVEKECHQWAGVANLGTSPTFNVNERLLEVHLLDFDANLYGRSIEVFFQQRIRDIVRFGNTEALTKQMLDDIDYVKGWRKTEKGLNI